MAGSLMPTNVMDVANYVQQQGTLGRQQGLQSRFDRLAGQAYTAPAGADRTALLGQAVATDPRSGIALGNQLAARDSAQQATQQAAEVDHAKKLGGAARYMVKALQTNNPAQINGAWQAVRPYLEQLTGKAAPEQWDPSMEQGLYQAIAATGGEPDVKGVVTSAGQTLVNPGSGEVMYRNPYAPKLIPNVPMGQGSAAGVFNPNDQTLTPATGGAQPTPPQGDPMQPFIAQANQAVQLGADPAKVEQWLLQQAQQIGVQPQGGTMGAPVQTKYMAETQPAGLVAPGNIDLSTRPSVKNPDGSISTVRSISIGTDKGEVLIPTVIGNRVVSNAEAIRHYQQTGENLGTFSDVPSANAYAEKLHQQQAAEYVPSVVGGLSQPQAAPAQFGVGTPKPSTADNTFSQLSPEEVAQLGLPPGTVAQRGSNGKIDVVTKPSATDARLSMQARTAKGALSGSLQQLDRLKQAAMDLKGDPGLGGVTGFRGHIPDLPGSDAARARAELDTLKSQIGFGVLQQMREMSKTGGALGSVSDRENTMLQNNLAALSTNQSAEDFARSLDKIINYVDDAKARMQGAYQDTYGDVAGDGQAQPQQPTADGVLRYNPVTGRIE